MEQEYLKLYSDVTASQVDWLWYPYIPYGKITLLEGDPGEGKSTLMMNLIAPLSTAGFMPDGSKVPSSCRITLVRTGSISRLPRATSAILCHSEFPMI